MIVCKPSVEARSQLLNRQALRYRIEVIAMDIDQDELCCSRIPAQEGHLPGAPWIGTVEMTGQRPSGIHVQYLNSVQLLYKLAEPVKLAMAVMTDHLTSLHPPEAGGICAFYRLR